MSTPEWFYANAGEHVGPFSSVQTVTNSNAYRSYDTTEYYTVYRVEGSAEQVDALTRQIEADAASVGLNLSQMEAQLEATIGGARESYWAGAEPIIRSLQEAD